MFGLAEGQLQGCQCLACLGASPSLARFVWEGKNEKEKKAGGFAPTLLPKSGNAAARRTARNDTLAPELEC